MCDTPSTSVSVRKQWRDLRARYSRLCWQYGAGEAARLLMRDGAFKFPDLYLRHRPAGDGWWVPNSIQASSDMKRWRDL